MSDSVSFASITIFHLIFLVIFAFLYSIEGKKLILLWSLSWGFFLLSAIFNQFSFYTDYRTLLMTLETIFSLLGVWAIVQGSIAFFSMSTLVVLRKPAKLINLITMVSGFYYLLAYFLKLPDAFFFIPNAISAGLLLVYVGILSIRTVYVNSVIRKVLGTVFIFWGIGSLVFLLVPYYGDSLLDATYSIMGLSAIAVSICLQLVYFLYNREYRDLLDEKMRYIAIHDPLTGVYNRAYGELLLEEMENQLPVTILLADLNSLKLVNDVFGHTTGDAMIIKAAELMKETAKEGLVVRWGGDEFLILLAQTHYGQGKSIADRIKKSTKEINTDEFPLDISFGLATKEHSSQTISEIIELADTSLYSHKFEESSRSKKSLVEFFKKMLFEKDIETTEHVSRMEELALLIANRMHLSKREQEELSLTAFFHDIGNISVPKDLLQKPGRLTSDEWVIMKRHAEIGYRILLSSSDFVPISHAVLSHHEFWDGTGYPQNLKGENIPLIARIIAIVDAYDAMVNFRVYKDPLSKEEALEEIERCAGTQFDPQISKIFVKAMREQRTTRM